MTLPELLTYIFQHFFGHILIAISVVLAALLFTRNEEKLTKILKLLENQHKTAEPELPDQFSKFEEKKETETRPATPPTLSVKQTLEKLTRAKERKEQNKNEET